MRWTGDDRDFFDGVFGSTDRRELALSLLEFSPLPDTMKRKIVDVLQKDGRK